MDEIRTGLVGLGGRGLYWMELMQRAKGYRVTAICDPMTALHERALDRLGELGWRDGVRVYSRYGEMLADQNVDAVVSCVRCKTKKRPLKAWPSMHRQCRPGR